jgi:hypothetical protein
MSDESEIPLVVTARTIERLTREGITEKQARELIALLGIDWPALLREARLIRGASSSEHPEQPSEEIADRDDSGEHGEKRHDG